MTQLYDSFAILSTALAPIHNKRGDEIRTAYVGPLPRRKLAAVQALLVAQQETIQAQAERIAALERQVRGLTEVQS